jgi:hypothetical protein
MASSVVCVDLGLSIERRTTGRYPGSGEWQSHILGNATTRWTSIVIDQNWERHRP